MRRRGGGLGCADNQKNKTACPRLGGPNQMTLFACEVPTKQLPVSASADRAPIIGRTRVPPLLPCDVRLNNRAGYLFNYVTTLPTEWSLPTGSLYLSTAPSESPVEMRERVPGTTCPIRTQNGRLASPGLSLLPLPAQNSASPTFLSSVGRELQGHAGKEGK